MNMFSYVCGAALLATVSTPAFAQTPPPTIPTVVVEGFTIKPLVDARLRYEGVDRDATPTDANAVTARLRLGLETRKGAWSMLAEGEAVGALKDDYNDTNAGNGVEPFANVGDPENLELNRLQIQYKTAPLTVTVGRQRIVLDDQRFVGNAGWRQSEQTYDAVRAEGSLGRFKLDGTYSRSQRTVFGSDAGPREAFDGDFVFLGASTIVGPVTIKAFAYLLDFADAIQFGNASNTVGARATGVLPIIGHAPVNFALSYARQTDAGSNPIAYSADYLATEVGTVLAGFTVAGGYELLGSDNGKGLQTPMASLHKFSGWADVFLTTPTAGLQDGYVTVARRFPKVTQLPGLNASLAYHDFNSDVGNIAYGTEWDAQVGVKIGRTGLMAKYAAYDADAFGVDVTKVWLMVEWAL